jgi:uracil-DNA glycosylase family 4
MDPDLSCRYLEAMGVTVWRLRHGVRAERPQDQSEAESDRAPGTIAAEQGAEMVPLQVSESLAADAVSAMDWQTLAQTVASCRACPLCGTRTNTVFGVGDPDAGLMVVGEAPGADEDRQGEPFVGRAGQLLDRMLASIGLDRRQVFIANILKCRPPGNRDPRPEEAVCCEPFLIRQIALVRPRVLLAVGGISAQNLLKTDVPVGRLRGRWFELGPDRIPLRVTYHPSYLLRSPEQKGKAWQDLLEVARRLAGSAEDADGD